MLYGLTEDYLGRHVLNFICSDRNDSDGKVEKYFYSPESFTVNDKIEQKPLILTFRTNMKRHVCVCWITSMFYWTMNTLGKSLRNKFITRNL